MSDPLSLELIAAAPAADRCPHLVQEPAGCHCGSGTLPPGLARLVTDCLSLQLWCLAGRDRWPVCIYYVAPEHSGPPGVSGDDTVHLLSGPAP